MFSASTGALLIEACAHARWISAMDMSVESGLVMICFIVLFQEILTPSPHLMGRIGNSRGWGGGSILFAAIHNLLIKVTIRSFQNYCW